MKIDGGLTCIKCKSIIFGLGKFVHHMMECDCNYFKHGDGELVVYAKLLNTQNQKNESAKGQVWRGDNP